MYQACKMKKMENIKIGYQKASFVHSFYYHPSTPKKL